MRLSMHAPGLRRLALLLVAVCLVLVAATVALVQRAGATTTTLVTFAKPGTYVWAVPKGVASVTFTVYGASGGWVLQRNANHTITIISKGGLGGEAKATFAVHVGEKFEIVVGGEGGVAYIGDSVEAPGGFNGGGVGSSFPYSYYSGGGGGASDVRIAGRGDNCVPTRSCSVGGRLVVGGGGGGGSQYGDNGDNGGGLRGTPNACDGLAGKESGAQDCAGLTPSPCSTVPGTAPRGVAGFGFGGSGCTNGAGGGGGGWWGGSTSQHNGAHGSSGGGGSGYISPFAKSGSFPGGTQRGDGKVIITTTT